MARLKINSPALVIHNLDEADNALARIAECQRAIDSADIQLAADLDERKARHTTDIKPVCQELDNLKLALCQYATSNKEALFRDKKSIARTFGVFGFRQSTKLLMDRGYKRDQLVGLLEEAHLDEYIRVKKQPDVDALRGCTPDMLALVHARLDSKDDFFIDIPSPQDTDTPAGIA